MVKKGLLNILKFKCYLVENGKYESFYEKDEIYAIRNILNIL